MDKPEFCWIDKYESEDIGMSAVNILPLFERKRDAVPFRITYNEAGEVIRLERVEE